MLVIAHIQIDPEGINTQAIAIYILESAQDVLSRFRLRVLATTLEIWEERAEGRVLEFTAETGEIVEEQDDA